MDPHRRAQRRRGNLRSSQHRPPAPESISGLTSWIADVFPEGEIPHVLRSLQQSLSTLRKQTPVEHENKLTMRLLNSLRRDPVLRDRAIQPDPQAYADGGETGIEGRPDIRFLFVCAGRSPAPYLVVEAKRLHVTFPGGKWQSLVSEYTIGHQGMMCFITGRYAGDQECGIMVGYVFDGDVTRARESGVTAP
jgi:hypothetical protein